MATQAQLDQAKAEYHKLLTGVKARVIVDSNGERVEYTSANRAALRAYIAELEDELGAAPLSRRPMGVYF